MLRKTKKQFWTEEETLILCHKKRKLETILEWLNIRYCEGEVVRVKGTETLGEVKHKETEKKCF